MDVNSQGIFQNILRLFLENRDLYEIIFMSLQVSLSAVLLAMLFGIPFGVYLFFGRFPGKKLIVNVVYTLMGLPTVLAGLIVYMILSRHGPLGEWQLLFTPMAMMIAQFVLVLLIISGLSMVAIKSKADRYTETALSLGANSWQVALTIIKEAKAEIMAGIITAFDRAIAEGWAVMLVGGNIEHHTRVMTSAIVLETRQGKFDLCPGFGCCISFSSIFRRVRYVPET